MGMPPGRGPAKVTDLDVPGFMPPTGAVTMDLRTISEAPEWGWMVRSKSRVSVLGVVMLPLLVSVTVTEALVGVPATMEAGTVFLVKARAKSRKPWVTAMAVE